MSCLQKVSGLLLDVFVLTVAYEGIIVYFLTSIYYVPLDKKTLITEQLFYLYLMNYVFF